MPWRAERGAGEATFTTRAGAGAMSRSSRSRVSKNGPRWLMPKVASNPSAVSVRSVRTRPALFTRTCIWSYRSSRTAAPFRTDARSARSNTTRPTGAEPLERRMSASASLPRDSLRAVITVRAPAPARAVAVALPTPELPPVITTVLPSMGATTFAGGLMAFLPLRSAGPTVGYRVRRYCPGSHRASAMGRQRRPGMRRSAIYRTAGPPDQPDACQAVVAAGAAVGAGPATSGAITAEGDAEGAVPASPATALGDPRRARRPIVMNRVADTETKVTQITRCSTGG